MTARPQVSFGRVSRLRWNFALPEWAGIAIGGHCTFPANGDIDVAGGRDFGESVVAGRHRTACAVPLL